MQSFVKIKPSRNGEIPLSSTVTDTDKSRPSCDFLRSLIHLLNAIIEKFLNLLQHCNKSPKSWFKLGPDSREK